MNDPRIVPPPPNYPPTVGGWHTAPEPTVIVVSPETRTDRRIVRHPVRTVTALLAALAPVASGYSAATGAATALRDAATTGHTSGAWSLAVAAIAISGFIDRRRDDWIGRLLLVTSVLGTVLSLPWLSAVLYVLTGVES
ncbi:hypothetical protein ACWGDX_24095 [Streptomyces sp. NPDC055025]